MGGQHCDTGQHITALRDFAGEIPCGYADGCLTLEQTILTAYHRGRLAPEHNVTGGLMAAVGLSAEAADVRLGKEGLTEVVVGCNNSPQSVTLAGNYPWNFICIFYYTCGLWG